MGHETPIRVRFYELDPYNHVNHATYVQYFEVGRVDFLGKIGYPMDELAEQGLQFVVTEITTKFLRSAGPEDDLVVITEVAELRRASSVWSQQILLGDDVICTQRIKAAITDLDSRPVRVPKHLQEAMKAGPPGL
ncbi:MAG: acyl-CoA thioesterase [Acidobacteria bacterium]|nr:acyl-CoA thioesterase [Acidobacteriota bacterium]